MSLIKRYILLLAGLTVMAFGVAFSIKGNLGTSPISSVPYAVSRFTPLTVGTATIVMHCVFIVIQIAVLRKKYQLEVPAHSADAAAGCLFLWISHRFWRLGRAGAPLCQLHAAMAGVSGGNSLGGDWSQHGGESRCGGPGRGRRGFSPLPGDPQGQVRLYEGGVRCDAGGSGLCAFLALYRAGAGRARGDSGRCCVCGTFGKTAGKTLGESEHIA